MKLKLFFGMLLVVFFSMAFSCEGDTDDVADKRDNIIGKWHATLDDGQVPEDYEVEITKDDVDNVKIHLANIVNNDGSAYATLTGFNLTIPEQQVGNATVSGDGTISDTYAEITWTLTIDGDSYTSSFVPGGITKDLEL
ncbi:MAG: hypothetical protein JXL97_18710 [Bacteroidales bacterium]|nr:hypothetical protein [Bacteroidales bacterium]